MGIVTSLRNMGREFWVSNFCGIHYRVSVCVSIFFYTFPVMMISMMLYALSLAIAVVAIADFNWTQGLICLCLCVVFIVAVIDIFFIMSKVFKVQGRGGYYKEYISICI